VKLRILQQLLNLNQAFDDVVSGLQRMEKLAPLDREDLRYTRAEIECARADANRDFLDKLGQIIEQDSTVAHKLCRQHERKTKDPFDLYLEIKDREDIRRKKGLPPRVVMLPDWDKDDEEPYDEEQARQQAAQRRGEAAGKPKPRPVGAASQGKTGVARAPERKK
jgi:hypothetical protein